MPTVLEWFLAEAGADVDEKAVSLLGEINGIAQLAIVKTLGEKGEEVRNPSAFVMKSARARGARPTIMEIGQAFEVLQKDPGIDDKLVRKLQNEDVETVTYAIGAYLGQEQGVVTNASAYITSKLVQHSKGAAQGGPPGAVAPPGGNMSRDAWDRMSTAMYELFSASQHSSQPMQVGSVIGQPRSMDSASSAGHSRRAPGYSHLMDKWGPRLDAAAHRHLKSVGHSIATEVLQEMDSREGSIRNPSAYVQNTIRKRHAEDGTTPPQADDGVIGPPREMEPPAVRNVRAGQAGPREMKPPPPRKKDKDEDPLNPDLDDKAMEALNELGEEDANGILQNLEQLMIAGSVINPSAYVTRAVTNLKNGQGRLAPTSGKPLPAKTEAKTEEGEVGGDQVPVSQELDEKALDALQQVSNEDSSKILETLSQLELSGKVRNSSAYVTKAVKNILDQKEGRHQPAPPAGLRPVSRQQAPISYPWRGEAMASNKSTARPLPVGVLTAPREDLSWPYPFDMPSGLDEEARGKLIEVGEEEAGRILDKLANVSSVRNPSAFVTKVARDVLIGKGTPATSSSMGRGPPIQAPPELNRLFEQWRPNLDKDAWDALQNLREQDAVSLLQKLETMHKNQQVKNPSAYVTNTARSMAREKASNDKLSAALAQWRSILDQEAMGMLQNLDPQEQLTLVDDLSTKGHQLRNPSAYVVRAIHHMRGRVGAPPAKRPRI